LKRLLGTKQVTASGVVLSFRFYCTSLSLLLLLRSLAFPTSLSILRLYGKLQLDVADGLVGLGGQVHVGSFAGAVLKKIANNV
jgi:hypothetical protein